VDHQTQQEQAAHDAKLTRVRAALDANCGNAGALQQVLGEVAACRTDLPAWQERVQFALAAVVAELEDLRAAVAEITDETPPRARYEGE